MELSERAGVRAWLDLARADLRLAELAVSEADSSPELAALVCFHAHQVVEKSLKGVLTALGRPVPLRHDVIQLAEHVARPDDVPPVLVQACSRLSEYGVGPRYPGFRPQGVTAGEAAEALAEARAVLAWVLGRLGEDQ